MQIRRAGDGVKQLVVDAMSCLIKVLTVLH